ncbi:MULTISPECIES: flagellar biosynthesis anti-sigma factor FlgM [Deefgea]|uniref:Negative regulator of flagellin synthesis n=1 Tax=Deefgea chitinilytica TaxID=570276 RepID=A0ABS2CBD2_9NEIS|nr:MULTISPECIES: flagellar biosynthesis anti-sigma factor FlgM [Deefgea]MBM5570940.1 flagellar biosynthesis anti-sigma factor FlgM [Deefgea chitinilytica]MBM9888170.1 flagellar biosynthesis anti-sigma factor FlgM [Deefgea sp. CFH1-16]
MKIDNSGKALGAVSARPLEGRSAAKAEQAAEQDSVSINPLAAKLSNVTGAGKSESTFDADKVAAIRQAIAEGRFSVNSEKIADGLLSSVKELLAR